MTLTLNPDIDYIEVHGTGTSLGDPIEFASLASVFGNARSKNHLLFIGSVKTNIGHLEGAAGIAGVIKTVLSLQHKEIPPHLHFEKANPLIALEKIPASIPLQLTPWVKESGIPRRAGVSSFGFSGTNAHIIMEEASYSKEEGKSPLGERPTHILTLSAKSKDVLEELIVHYQSYFADHLSISLADSAFTANVGRSHFSHRLAIIANGTTQLLHKLCTRDFIGRNCVEKQSQKIAFLFTAQNMPLICLGRELYDSEPRFKIALDECAILAKEYTHTPLLMILFATDVEYSMRVKPMDAQIALFALEYALAKLWKSWGITPDYVLGEGVGEYVAAIVAGILSVSDGLMLVWARACLIQALSIDGDESNLASRVPALEAFTKVAETILYNNPQLGMISSLDGEKASLEVLHAEYWIKHILNPIKCEECLHILRDFGCSVYIEVGPPLTLLEKEVQFINNDPCIRLSSLQASFDSWKTLLDSLARLYIHGVNIDWKGFDTPYHRQKVLLPTYPFQRQRYWAKSAIASAVAGSHYRNVVHPLLGM